MYRQLNINNYETNFILGNNEDEKIEKRRVLISISLRFSEENASCRSDNLADTVCYASLLEFIEAKLQNASFNLIERAAGFIYEAIGEYLKDKTNHVQRRVEVTKIAPPVAGLESASFVVGEW